MPAVAALILIVVEVVIAAADEAAIDAGKVGGVAGQAAVLVPRDLGIDAERPRAGEAT